MKMNVIFLSAILLCASSLSLSLRSSQASPVTPSPPPEKSNVQECTWTNIHAPYAVPETPRTRFIAIILLIVWSSIYLSVRLILSSFKDKSDPFIRKSLNSLLQETNSLLIAIFFLTCFYVSGLWDKYGVNGEYLINGLGMFGVFWVIFSFALILGCYFHVKQWREYEKAADGGFDGLRDIQEKRYEKMEYLLMKMNFIIPLFPTYKASLLKKEFNFSKYLEYSLIKNLSMIFQISWTCWLILILSSFFWAVSFSTLTIGRFTCLFLFLPLIWLFLLVVIYIYERRTYRDSVGVIGQMNQDTLRDLEMENYNQVHANEAYGKYNNYLENVIKRPDSLFLGWFNFHEHFQNRAPSYYEDNMLFGSSGFVLLLNTIQAIGLIIIAWSILLWFKHISYIINALTGYFLILLIPLYLCYLFAFLLCISLCLKWHTIISSIEMKRDERIIEKVVKQQYTINARLANSVFNSFKIIYIFYKNETPCNSKPIENIPDNLKRYIDMSFARFKRMNQPAKMNANHEKADSNLFENNPIDPVLELKGFMKSCGNSLTEEEIRLMLGFIYDYRTSDPITVDQFYEIWAHVIHFQKQAPEEIIEYVMKNYFREDEIGTKRITCETIAEFLEKNKEYFVEEEHNFILKEVRALGKEFTVRDFILSLTIARRYHPF